MFASEPMVFVNLGEDYCGGHALPWRGVLLRPVFAVWARVCSWQRGIGCIARFVARTFWMLFALYTALACVLMRSTALDYMLLRLLSAT